MLKSFAKTVLAATSLTIVAFVNVAIAEDANIKDMSFKITVPYKSDITVTSSDGKRWDTIVPTTIPLWADIEVDTRHPGYVERAGLFLGDCAGTACGGNPRLAYWNFKTRDWSFHGKFQFDTSRIPVSTTGIATVGVGDEIIAGCNLKHADAQATTKGHSLGVPVTASLSVNTRTSVLSFWNPYLNQPYTDPAIPFNGGDANVKTTFLLKVNCLSLSMIEAAPKPVSVDIRVAQKSNSCPKDAEVTAFIDYEKPMTGRFQVVHNGKPGQTLEIKAREVSLAGKTWYRIERLERYALDPGKHDFQIKVIGGGESPTKSLDVDCPSFKVTSAWLTYDVESKDTCPKKVVEKATFKANGPGSAPFEIKTQGGLVVHSGTAKFERKGTDYVAEARRNLSLGAFDSEMMALIKNDVANSGWTKLKVDCVDALSGKLTLQGLGATSCKGEALVAIHTDGAGDLPYELECGPGKSWQRTVTAHANKIGVDKVRFDVTNNEQVTCALRTRIGGVLKPLDGASMTFACHKPTGVSGSDDLASEMQPDPQAPDKPGIIVIDPPRQIDEDEPEPEISCAGGTVKGGDCVCDRTHKAVKTGKNAWRCVKVVVDPKPDKTTISDPKISCAGGTVRGGACTCARTHKPVKAGKNAWRCVKVVVIDPPRNKDSAHSSGAKIKADAKSSAKKGKGKSRPASGSSSSAPR